MSYHVYYRIIIKYQNIIHLICALFCRIIKYLIQKKKKKYHSQIINHSTLPSNASLQCILAATLPKLHLIILSSCHPSTNCNSITTIIHHQNSPIRGIKKIILQSIHDEFPNINNKKKKKKKKKNEHHTTINVQSIFPIFFFLAQRFYPIGLRVRQLFFLDKETKILSRNPSYLFFV